MCLCVCVWVGVHVHVCMCVGGCGWVDGVWVVGVGVGVHAYKLCMWVCGWVFVCVLSFALDKISILVVNININPKLTKQ